MEVAILCGRIIDSLHDMVFIIFYELNSFYQRRGLLQAAAFLKSHSFRCIS